MAYRFSPPKREEMARVKFLRLLVLWCFIALLIAGISFLGTGRSHAHNLQVTSSVKFETPALVCDSSAQVQQVIHDTMATHRLDMALEKVNEGIKGGEEPRCEAQPKLIAWYIKDDTSFSLGGWKFTVIQITGDHKHFYYTFVVDKEETPT